MADPVVVVGAGLAGLRAADVLHRAGAPVVVLEARSRPGGRVHTIRAPFAEGLYAEAGAIRIPPQHDTVIQLAKEHGLKLIVAGGLESWRCTDLLKANDVAVLLNVERLPGRRSDAYDAAYTVPAKLQEAGVRFAIVSDETAQSRNLPFEAAMARAYGLPAAAALRAIP